MSANSTTLATFSSRPSPDGTGPEFFVTDHAGVELVLVTDEALVLSKAVDAPTGGHGTEQAVRTTIVDFMAAALAAQQEALRELGADVPAAVADEPAQEKKARRPRRTAKAAEPVVEQAEEPAPAEAAVAEQAEPVPAEPVAEQAEEPEPAAEVVAEPEKVTRGQKADFEQDVHALAEFHQTLGRWPSSSSQDADEKRLGSFLSNQRARGRSSVMAPENLELLDAVAPGWAGATATTKAPVEVPVEASQVQDEPADTEPAASDDESFVPSDVEPAAEDEPAAAEPAATAVIFNDDDAF